MANLLTGLRLLLAVPVALAIADESLLPPTALVATLLAAIASDVLDGKAARTRGTASAVGQLFDHATDCLFVSACLAAAASAGLAPWLLPPLITAAFLQYVLDSHWLQRRKSLRMSFLGRWNGILYFVPPLLIATARLQAEGEWRELLTQAAALLCWLLIVSTVASIIDRALAARDTRFSTISR